MSCAEFWASHSLLLVGTKTKRLLLARVEHRSDPIATLQCPFCNLQCNPPSLRVSMLLCPLAWMTLSLRVVWEGLSPLLRHVQVERVLLSVNS